MGETMGEEFSKMKHHRQRKAVYLNKLQQK